ncbi:CLUMA_CG000185, isoform A [Clunio marinus]|uniref:Mitochondrial import inner membrane translocase subunit Tim21 n=1 Tax=Clunio marinus TaxID=568069 RepID=A0A1J1HEY2_9DIPT|nr:CLUMA_CG000185, isoform A [Clunio marinus]
MALLIRCLNYQSRMILRQFSSSRVCFQIEKSNDRQKIVKSESHKDIGKAKPFGERVKETAKTTSYLGIILVGVGVTGIMLYAIFKELFSNNSPQAVYSDAFERCKADTRVQDSLGLPIKAYGEETRRRRRNHVAHQIYQKNNRNYMRLSFHIQGIRNKATVHCEMRESDSGRYECRYLFVQLDSYPHTTIIVEDNRFNDPLDSPAD